MRQPLVPLMPGSGRTIWFSNHGNYQQGFICSRHCDKRRLSQIFSNLRHKALLRLERHECVQQLEFWSIWDVERLLLAGESRRAPNLMIFR